MSSRREEKDAARRKREEAEAQAKLAASRRQRIQIALGGLVAVAAIGGVVAAFALGGGDDATPGGGGGTTPKAAAIPPVETADLTAAAKAAGATFTQYRYEYGTGNHVLDKVKYPQNPPTNGPHHPEWASDANYAGLETPPTEKLVHALEHGRVEIQYSPDLPQAQIDQLVALYEEDPYHVLLFENETDMPAQVAATAWAHGMLIKEASPAMFDALRAFRDKYRDQAPEKVA